ncbi:MAG: ATP-binding protein [Bacteroidota bacterium]
MIIARIDFRYSLLKKIHDLAAHLFLLTFIFLTAWLPNLTYAQTTEIDSLQSLLASSHAQPVQAADICIQLAQATYNQSLEEALHYAQEGTEHGKSAKDQDRIGKGYIWQGRMLGELRRLEEAEAAYLQAATFLEGSTDSTLLGQLYNGQGLILRYQGNYQEAIEKIYLAVDLLIASRDSVSTASALNSIANLQVAMRDTVESIGVWKRALTFLPGEGYFGTRAGIMINMAGHMDHMPAQKLHLLDSLEKILLPRNQYRFLCYTYSCMAEYYELFPVSVDSQKKYYRLAVEYAKKSQDAYMYAFNSLYLGILETEGQPQVAENRIREALANPTIRENDLMRAEGNKYLSRSLYSQRKYQAAYDALDSARKNYQKIYDARNSEQLAEAEKKYELADKERKINMQKLQLAEEQNARSQLMIGSLILLVLVVGGYQWYLMRQRKRKQAAERALEVQQMEANKLRELDQFKTQFFTNVSHELRTPLTLIISPLSDVLSQIQSVPIRQRLHTVQQNAQRLLSLVNEIMDLSKVEAGNLRLNSVPVALHPFVRRIFGTMESMAEVREIDYQLSMTTVDAHVRIDLDKFEKILQNLLSNALKFTPNRGKVHLNIYQEEGIFFFEVKDSGHGISSADLPYIFDRFYQSTVQPATLQGGTGVGLSLAKELAQLMGGDIQVESRQGEGSTFTLQLPLEETTAPTPPRPIETPEEWGHQALPQFAPMTVQGEKPHVLVVEDNKEMGAYLIQILSDQYHCIWANNGEEGLKQLKNQHFDAIISDVMMPQMDGFTFREKINEHKDWKRIPFVLLTARHLEADKLKGFQLGIDDYLTKPFSTPEVKARLFNLIQNKRERIAYLEEQMAEPREVVLTQDEQMLRMLEGEVLGNLDNPQFGVEALAQTSNYSSKQLGRIIKRLTGMTTVNFILEIRLQKARELLEQRAVATVFEAQVQVGINSTSYFTRKFTERFGKNPSEMGK